MNENKPLINNENQENFAYSKKLYESPNEKERLAQQMSLPIQQTTSEFFSKNRSTEASSIIKNPQTMSNSISMSSSKFSSDVNSAMLTKTAQDMLRNINKKREDEKHIHAEFETCITDWSVQFTSKCIETMTNKYENYTKVIQNKLCLINDKLEDIQNMEQELKGISDEVERLYNDILNESKH